MVKKGLKVGETFTDDNLLYKITAIDSQGNYISSLVGKASEGVKAPKKAEEKVEVEEADYDKTAYSDLKRIAKEKGISAKGSKEELVDRLKGV